MSHLAVASSRYHRDGHWLGGVSVALFPVPPPAQSRMETDVSVDRKPNEKPDHDKTSCSERAQASPRTTRVRVQAERQRRSKPVMAREILLSVGRFNRFGAGSDGHFSRHATSLRCQIPSFGRDRGQVRKPAPADGHEQSLSGMDDLPVPRLLAADDTVPDPISPQKTCTVGVSRPGNDIRGWQTDRRFSMVKDRLIATLGSFRAHESEGTCGTE